MALQFSTALRNARADIIESLIGPGAQIRFWTGSPPASTAAAATGTLLASVTLGGDWAAPASGGAKSLSGTPVAVSVVAGGTIGYFRVFDNGNAACHVQGSVGPAGSVPPFDWPIDNPAVVAGQGLSIAGLTVAEGNA